MTAQAKEKKAKGNGNEASGPTVAITPINKQYIQVCIKGTTPLIVNRFHEKIRKQLSDKHQGEEQKGAKAPRVPEEEYELAFYRTPKTKQYAISASGLKKAMISACTSTNKGLTKVFARQAFHVLGCEEDSGLIPLIHSEPRMREDMGRLKPSNTPRVIWRPEFPKWGAEFAILYNANVINPSSIINLLNLAGFSVGLHEWRNERDGVFGGFEVAKNRAEVEKHVRG